MHYNIKSETLAQAYHKALNVLYTGGHIRPCPAYNTRENAISATIRVSKPLSSPRMSKLLVCDPASLQQYLMEMEDGIMDFECAVGNWPYTYHARMIGQLIKAVRLLKNDPYSRRAAITIRRPDDLDMDDPPCLQLIQFLVNNGKLDCFVTFRSNDALKAFFMNAFALIDIQRIVAEVLGLPVGKYVHTANSFHAYESDWPRLKEFYRRIREDSYHSLAMDTGMFLDWMADMEEAIPSIQKKVAQQKEKYGICGDGKYVGPLKEVLMNNI